MPRILLLLVLLLLPVMPAQAQAADRARVTQVDSSHYPDLTLYVSVADPSGALVGGLAARDFAVTEDGVPVTLSGFAGGGTGAVSTVLVIDRSGSMGQNDKIEGAQAAARAFVEQMRPGDRTALIAFNSEARTIRPFTADQTALLDAIERLTPDGGTALYDSVVAGVDTLANVQGRRALVLLSDGQDCRESRSCPDQYGSRRSLDQAIAYASRQAQPLYVVGLGERGRDGQDGIDEPALDRIARETGGEYFYTPSASALAGLYRKLSADIQQEYALTYRSPRPFYDGTRRDIRVSVGGAPAASGGYVEQHLINVRSDPLVGALLLVPILGALLLPALVRRRTRPAAPVAVDAPPGPALGATMIAARKIVLFRPSLPRCQSCDAPLLNAQARFCAECGAAQIAEPARAAGRTFCDQCGWPIRAGGRFCSHCGATTPVLAGDSRGSA